MQAVPMDHAPDQDADLSFASEAGKVDSATGRSWTVRPFEVTHRSVWAITLPMTFAYLTTPLLGLTDTGVVGRTGDATALGGLAVGALIFDFAFSTFNFLRSGTTGLTAQAVGRGNAREVQAVFWRSLILALGIGVVLLLLARPVLALGLMAVAPGAGVAAATQTYVLVRMLSAPFALLNYAILGHVLGLGRGTLGLLLQIVVNGINIVLSILFGLVMGYGIAGVAFGTVCGEVAGTVVGMTIVLRSFRLQPRADRSEVFDRTGFLQMIAVNRDIMIRSFCLLGAYLLFTRFGAAFGALTLAANGILMNLFLVGSFLLDGLATACEQLAGRAVGARYRPAFDRIVTLAVGWGFALSSILFVVFWLFGDWLVAALTTDPAVRAQAANYLIFAALTPLAGVLAFIMDGIFIGATWSRTMRDMMIASFLLFALIAWSLSSLLGNGGLWIAMLVFLGARGVTLLLVLPRRRVAAFAAPQSVPT